MRFWLAALLFLTLASAASADYPAAFIRPGDTMSFSACLDPVPWESQWIYWTVELVEYGGHNHTLQGRPQAWLDPEGAWTESNGCAVGGFYSDIEQYSGVWRIHAVAYGWPGLDSYMDVAVGVFDPVLETSPPSYWYQLDPEYQPSHPWNHSGTLSTVIKIQDTTWQFYNETGQAACVNDMSIL